MLENIKVGTKVNFDKFIFETKDIVKDDEIYKRIYGRSYHPNDYISINELSYIKMLHYDYNGDIIVGEMIVNKVIIDEVREVFNNLFKLKYQINSMRLIDDFWIDNNPLKTDRNSILHNNSSCFCYRKISNKETLSNHAFAIAIDINPLDNPYTPRKEDGTFDDSILSEYEKSILIDRKNKAKINPHIITLGDSICKIFDEVGFECGGIWLLQSNDWSRDWQHFEPNVEKMSIVMERIELLKKKEKKYYK